MLHHRSPRGIFTTRFIARIMAVVSLLLLEPAWPAAQPPPTITIVALGDSLTDGYGIEKSKAYPQLVETKLRRDGYNVKIINAGISGSTTAGAEQRLRWFLKSGPQILILALGANDGLRGFPHDTTRENLTKTIRLAKEKGIRVLLAGMMLPPNYGADYTAKFKDLFKDIAQKEKIDLIPFLLEGVAGERQYNLEDGIHPNEEGQKRVAETVYKHLKPIVQQLHAGTKSTAKANSGGKAK